jgi:hypothetical protein
MSLLPECYEEPTIWGMTPGDQGYTLPWAMWPDDHRKLWINGDYPVQDQAEKTMQLRIERTKRGVIVDQRTIGAHRYSPGVSSWDKSPHKLEVTLK